MSNYDMDEIERKQSQKQKKQWREYVDKSLEHPLDNRYSSQEGFGRDDQDNIKEILRKNSKIPSKSCQQWDAQTQSYVTVVKDHIKSENEEMTNDPVGYERKHTPKSTLPLGNRDKIDEATGMILASRPKLDKIEACALPLVDDNTSREELDMLRRPLEKEEVTNPKHYDKVGFGIQPLEYIIANELDFLEGNVIKYVSRYPHKGGLNDLLKARTYIEKLIERERIKDE